MRIGMGYDVHKLVEDRKLICGLIFGFCAIIVASILLIEYPFSKIIRPVSSSKFMLDI
ncbi:hypothetical protein Q604_UNBC16415G0001, partial [human gut metagenome]